MKIIVTSSQSTEYVKHQVLHQMQQQILKFVISFTFYKITNQKLKLSLIKKSLLVTELNKFGVIGLLHLHKRISLSHVAEFPFTTVLVFHNLF